MSFAPYSGQRHEEPASNSNTTEMICGQKCCILELDFENDSQDDGVGGD